MQFSDSTIPNTICTNVEESYHSFTHNHNERELNEIFNPLKTLIVERTSKNGKES